MKSHISTRVLFALGILGMFAAGCSSTAQDDMGTAQLRLIAPQAVASELTRVSIETDTGFSTDLVRDAGGDFTGTLALPAGIHAFTGKAFIDADQVGESTPVSGEILAGLVTSVMLQILDTTGGNQPDFGPILESLTHPSSTEAGVAVMFTVSVVDLDGDPVTIAWSDDCADSTFSASASTTTDWSSATPGTCHVTVTGTSGDKSVSASFDIVVFDPTASTGAASVSTVFIAAPSISISASLPAGNCFISSFASNAVCSGAIASPDRAIMSAFVSWENGVPGTISIADDCGGSFQVFSDPQAQEFLDTEWLPPVTGGICRIIVEATNGQGVTARLSAAVLVRDGAAPPPVAPFVEIGMVTPIAGCIVNSIEIQPFPCGVVRPGEDVTINGFVDWRGGFPGTFELVDDCGGTFLDDPNNPSDPTTGAVGALWQPPAQAGIQCTISGVATTPSGLSSAAAGMFDIQ